MKRENIENAGVNVYGPHTNSPLNQ